jgi:hypothetical protein
MRAEKANMRWCKILPLIVFSAAWLAIAAHAWAQVPPEELHHLDALRKGRKTDFAAVEKKGRELLKEFPEPADQGLIYYRLAHVYAQSGVDQNPYKVLEHAATALRFPLPNDERLRLHTYSGDAASVTKKPLIERRREAAVYYLVGLQEIAARKLATEAADPGPGPGRFSGEEDAAQEKARAAAYEKWNAENQTFKHAQMVAMHQRVMARQITELYRRKPAATKELEELTLKYLGNVPLRDEMLATVKAPTAPAVKPPKVETLIE